MKSELGTTFKSAAAVLLFTASICSANPDFSECVPTSTVEAFLSRGYNTPELSANILDTFPKFAQPKNTDVLGSLKVAHSTSVILQAKNSKLKLLPLLTKAFKDEDWEVQLNPMVATGGFQTHTNQKFLETKNFCHKKQGQLSIDIADKDGNNYAKINHYSSHYSSCQAPNFPFFTHDGGISKYMPKLLLPEGSSTTNPSMGGGAFSGGSDNLSTTIVLKFDKSLDEIQNHFSAQLKSQGWIQDASWLGQSSSGSVWKLTTESDTHIAGTLSILKYAQGEFHGQFTMTMLEL